MKQNFFLVFTALWLSFMTWVWGWGTLSCYYPFLLSAKHYVVIKNPTLRKLLISDRLNRSSNTKTRLVDRDKLPVIGVCYYIVEAILLGAFYISSIFTIVSDVSGTDSELIHTLATPSPYLLAGILLFGALAFLVYRIDYGVGKLCDPNGGRL